MSKFLRSAMRNAFLPALVLCAGAVTISDDAMAQEKKSTTSGDKKIASKKGVEGSLGQKEIDADKLPGKLEIGIAFGSIAAAVAAFKYL